MRSITSLGGAPAAPFSPAVSAGGFIYVSGTIAQDASGAILGKGDVGAQTKRVLERMREILSAAGSSLDRVVAVMVYLRSAADFAAMNEVYRTFWTAEPPTRTTVTAGLVLPDALVEMTMIAVPAGAERVVLHPADWPKAPNPYSYAIRSGETLFLSGLVPRRGRDNAVVTGDVGAQTRAIMDNAAALLDAAGLTFDHVVSARVYLPDRSAFQQMNEVYRSCFPGAPPARATVQAGLMGSGYAIEITMIASAAPKQAIDDGRPPNPNLSAAVSAGRHVYLAGMLGDTPETKGDVGAQTRETLARIGNALAAAGCSPGDVAESLVYLTDLRTYGEMNEAYRAFFQRDFPARATVESSLVAPDGLVEIMVTAVQS